MAEVSAAATAASAPPPAAEVALPELPIASFAMDAAGARIAVQIVFLDKAVAVWVGSQAALGNIVLAAPSRFDPVPLSSILLGSPRDTQARSYSQIIAKKTGQQCFFSWANMEREKDDVKEAVLARVLAELRQPSA
eukprot:m.74424 g.74424  ORF g.74424 m.74424 type:complete len:136 (-) comp14502_c0_seq1:1083-1490(-)